MPILTDPAPATGMEAVKTAMTTAVSFMTSAFDAMTANGYTVHFRKQINSTGVKNIIDELVTGAILDK